MNDYRFANYLYEKEKDSRYFTKPGRQIAWGKRQSCFQMEKRKAKPTTDTLRKLAVSVDELL